MSKAYEMIMDSLEEIIDDLQTTNGKNLKRETLSAEKSESKIEELKNFKPARLRLKNKENLAS